MYRPFKTYNQWLGDLIRKIGIDVAKSREFNDDYIQLFEGHTNLHFIFTRVLFIVLCVIISLPYHAKAGDCPVLKPEECPIGSSLTEATIEDGKKSIECLTKDGLREGPSVTCYANGLTAEQGTYSKGQKKRSLG